MAIKLADTARPNNHIDAEHPGTFPVAYAEDVWFADGTRLSEKTFDGQSIQVEELPLASATEEGKIYQYIGESGTYKHGYFYECVEDDGVYSWKEKTISTDYPIKEVDTLPTGDNIENYIYGKRDSEYSLNIAGLSKTEIEEALIANGFTIATTPHSYSYEYLITYPTPIDVWHPTEKKWLTPEDYDYISFNKTNPPELAIVRTNAAGQKVTMYIGTYGDYTVLKYSDPTSYYIGDSSRKSTEQLVLHREIGSLTNSVEYTSTIPVFNPTDTKDGVVIVFSGEDTDGFLQGHHYRWSENFSATIKECRIKTNAEGSYLMTYINQDEELKVGTHLYTRNGSSYWCQTLVSAMESDYITLYDVNTKQSTTYTYGYTIIEDSPSTVTISYDWVDIGGGGDGGNDYEEFVGTQAEWDALSQSQKDKYDGKIVNITDRESGCGVTDVVEENNMSAVTSNAVYHKIEDTQYVPPVTYKNISLNTQNVPNISAISGQGLRAIRMGNILMLNYYLKVTAKSTAVTSKVFFDLSSLNSLLNTGESIMEESKLPQVGAILLSDQTGSSSGVISMDGLNKITIPPNRSCNIIGQVVLAINHS